MKVNLGLRLRNHGASTIFGPSGGSGGPSLTEQVQGLFAKYSGVGGMWSAVEAANIFQSSAGTGAVLSAGDPVGYVTDLNTGAYPWQQATSSMRPVWNGDGVTPDGAGDNYVTSTITLSSCDKLVTAMGYAKLDDTVRMQFEFGGTGGDAGAFWLLSGNNGVAHQSALANGTPGGFNEASFASARVSEYGAHIARHSIPGDLSEVWWNGVKGTNATADKGTGTFANRSLNVFNRDGGTVLSNTPARRGFVMGIPVASAQMSDDDIELIRLWLMGPADGVFF